MTEAFTLKSIERFDVPDSNYEAIMVCAELAPHARSGLHTHPGFDAAYLLEGELDVLQQGEPDKPIRAGQSWLVQPGVVHEVRAGDRAARVLGIYVIEKGKPVRTDWPSA